MLRFENDYTQGACPEVLEALVSTNLCQSAGYGMDEYCEKAAGLIRKLCCAPDAAVHFLMGGTQTNLTLIASALKPYEGVLSADSGHIQTHESGAVEATGHRVMVLPTKDGKLTAKAVEAAVQAAKDDVSAVQPGMAYISLPTENGGLYKKEELIALSQVCRKEGLYLYLDGARLGYGLAAAGEDLSMADLAALCDAFYIGGTKQGALFGEALVITNPELMQSFRWHMKQRGAMLAKGRLLGVQFYALFEGGAYLAHSRRAVEQASYMAKRLEQAGIPLHFPQETNQLFPVLTKEQMERLNQCATCAHWAELPDGRQVVRLCTSWGSKMEDVETVLGALIGE